MAKTNKYLVFFGIIFITFFACRLLISLHAAETRTLIPLRDFFKNPEKAGYALSPKGDYISFLAPYNNRLNIYVQETNKNTPLRITSVTQRDIRQYFWKNDDMLIYLLDDKGDENFHLFGISKDGKIFKDYTPFAGVRADIVDLLEDDNDHLLIMMNKRDKTAFDVYRLNIQTGNLTLITQNPGKVIQWGTDWDGKLRTAVESDGVNRNILYRADESEPFKVLVTSDFKTTAIPFGFTNDNKQLYLVSNVDRDKKALVLFDPATQKESQLIFEQQDFDVSSAHFSRKRKQLVMAEFISWKNEHVFFDDQTKAMFARVERELQGYEIYCVSHNKNEDRFIFRTLSDRNPGSYYFYDLQADSLTKLADLKPWLKEEQLAPMKPITYVSRDNVVIHGYLTLPINCLHKNLPTIVNPHGGPWLRDIWSFNPEIQFLANRGYAILQVNFRGSLGFGKKFWQLSFKQWGRNMQNDITDGVQWLIDQGIADSKRIAIYGGSYGGYATLAGLAFTPDLYACGIDYVGVSNLFTFVKSMPEYWKPFLEAIYEKVGHPERDKELLTQISPVFHADKIKSPLFIAQGRMDPRVNINESDQMVEAMKKRGVEVTYMIKDNEGHGFSNEENKFDFFEAIERFLARYLQPNMLAKNSQQVTA